MAKISQASSKYIISAKIEIDGVVDRPDVVGAIFGQVEGLLGADLELRELQRSGRIGRIEVNVKSKDGKTTGTVTIPSSLDKAETAIVGGALEIIERIGPCSAEITVTDIRDERIEKRQQVISRAKQLLKNLNDSVLPESQELSNEVSEGIRLMEIGTFGPGLACGPAIATDDEIIFVEGRADVVNMLKHGFKNVISVNGTSVPDEIKKLSKKKKVTIFCDGDRGGDLIIKGLTDTCDIDYITKAPDGKEVEELQKKEIHQALRHKKKASSWDNNSSNKKSSKKKSSSRSKGRSKNSSRNKKSSSKKSSSNKKPKLSDKQKKHYKKLHKDLKRNEAYVLDTNDSILGKVPAKELPSTLPNLDNARGVVMKHKLDGTVAKALDKGRIKTAIVSSGNANTRAAVEYAKNL